MTDATDMTPTIEPKATELTADHLLTGPRTIKITGVEISPGTERPVTISYERDGGLPFKPCKTVSRILVNAWGPDASKYIGRSITLFRDPTVKWGGLAVGGLRPSHLSHIDGPLTMALTMTKGSKKPLTVQPLKLAAEKATQTARAVKDQPTDREPPKPLSDAAIAAEDIIPDEPTVSLNDWADTIERHLDLAPDRAAAIAIFTEAAKETEWAALKIDDPTRATALRAKVTDFGKGK